MPCIIFDVNKILVFFNGSSPKLQFDNTTNFNSFLT